VYHPSKILQVATLAYLVHNFSQTEDVQEACKLFNKIDINGDGKITKDELIKGFQQFLEVSPDSIVDDVDKIFRNIDSDNNGFIEFEEFVRGAIDKEKFLQEDTLKFAFQYFDKDGSGEITSEEIKKVFFSTNTKINPEVVDNQMKLIIQEVDQNSDGKISFQEFSTMMKNILDYE